MLVVQRLALKNISHVADFGECCGTNDGLGIVDSIAFSSITEKDIFADLCNTSSARQDRTCCGIERSSACKAFHAVKSAGFPGI